mmetsp:Transcript_4121/g.10459  ORF Transcript_4121/g.10459 Transcript_4121/m.10459 type:complete len:223 (-) Transcript_4121:402-1070(-)
MKRRLSVLPPVIFLCSVVGVYAAEHNVAGLRAGGRGFRRINEERLAFNTLPQRKLEEDEADADADANADEHDDAVDDTVAGDDDTNGANGTSSTIDNIKSRVQSYASDAGSSAWEFYESPPSEWTTAQWDVVLGILLLSFIVCFTASACCAYCCCLNSRDEDWKGLNQTTPTSRSINSRDRRRSGRRTGQSGKRRNNYDDHYDIYSSDEEDDGKGCKFSCLV